jgi:cephalosporin-C deacetylase-like acetyl esterase
MRITPIPSDFDDTWSATLDELARYPIAAELTPMPIRSTEFCDVYGVKLTSVGPYRIFAYYSAPKGDGPFPTLFIAPRYGSVVHVPAFEQRQRYAVLALMHRGQRLSDQPYAAAYPGLLTDGIADPATYIYFEIVADCCRAIDFLLSRPEVDRARINTWGNELALFAAALRPQVTSLVYSPELFYATREIAPRVSGYPLEEFNDFARVHPDQAEAMWGTLAYFEPVHFASRVQARMLLVTGSDKDVYSRVTLSQLIEALYDRVELYESAHSASRDGAFLETWLARRNGFEEAILPAQWM